ncbi:hypothetical protein [Flaviaesturariibacter aridisoli]|uniref:Uncharacterized protein n=1 Tax=Flaviaesturariibacter aridisoli TaxID=2545761 RepID=A0A4R4E4G6_9BACT|nr:hypothetical protein [Flaviaesturariibacter aridisoli]TCZ73827.1 hypothetical protein E0486_03865 [Flaviaesturariibacter aridisoli]
MEKKLSKEHFFNSDALDNAIKSTDSFIRHSSQEYVGNYFYHSMQAFSSLASLCKLDAKEKRLEIRKFAALNESLFGGIGDVNELYKRYYYLSLRHLYYRSREYFYEGSTYRGSEDFDFVRRGNGSLLLTGGHFIDSNCIVIQEFPDDTSLYTIDSKVASRLKIERYKLYIHGCLATQRNDVIQRKEEEHSCYICEHCGRELVIHGYSKKAILGPWVPFNENWMKQQELQKEYRAISEVEAVAFFRNNAAVHINKFYEGYLRLFDRKPSVYENPVSLLGNDYYNDDYNAP